MSASYACASGNSGLSREIVGMPILIFFLAVLSLFAVKPNIVLVLTDDLGWQDVACYDIDKPSPMETPNIDALAKRGVLFWQAYAPSPTCAPTRCAIMSGIHPARAQKTHVVGGAPPAPHHKFAHPMMPPWYSGRMPESTFTLAKALRKAGYVTGHSGKWHMAIDHHSYPQPEDQGFDWTRAERGARSGMHPHRLANFATSAKNDPYRLDENGFPYHSVSEHALTFVQESKDKPFFLYYATWLVHTPIHTRSEALLDKYCKKLGIPRPTDPKGWTLEGQQNPYYCAMVEELDYYVGKLFRYLETTDDPRNPGKKLVDNTYVIFTSDNGGMEGGGGEIITDNYPLDRGKISLMEGGTRVPLVIAGPGIPAGVESQVMVNGLDFYPTIMSWVGAPQPEGLDGLNLAKLLATDPTDASLVDRDTMVWHFPNSIALESSIRIGDYKLVRNYSYRYVPNVPELELYRLYDGAKRVDIEEANNLAATEPERARAMNQRLSEMLTEMKASYPYYNPHFRRAGPEKRQIPSVQSYDRNGPLFIFKVKENGARVVAADLIFTRNGGQRYEEWYRMPASIQGDGTVAARAPKGSTHVYLNLVDENNFLVSYPETPDGVAMREKGASYSAKALAVSQP